MALSLHSQVDLVAAFSFLGFVLISIPLYWHWQAWNVGCILYIFWVGGQCLFQGINMLIWKDNVINSAPVWCDIFVRFYIGASIGLCCASLVINRRLYLIATSAVVNVRYEDKVRRIMVDLLIGLGIPVLAMAVFWFYQGHRFDIIEGIGCVEAYPNTWLAIILYFAWPFFIGIISACYCYKTLKAFLARRKEFSQLMSSNEHLTYNRYFRLMGLAALDILFTIPLTVYNIASNYKQNYYPWRGFADLHSNFGRVDQYPAVIWRADPQAVSILNFRVWTPVACALAFFMCFGFANEAIKHYKKVLAALGIKIDRNTTNSPSADARSFAYALSLFVCFWRALTSQCLLGVACRSRTPGSARTPVTPSFVKPLPRRDSLESFYTSDASTRESAVCLDHKASSLSGRSAGSSTFLAEAEDATLSPIAPPVPSTPLPSHVDLPKPAAAHIRRSSQHEFDDMFESIAVGPDMV
uniref:Pheromone receptor CPRa1p n=1 Tax=Ganoderma boninense TaxID=34458 RepID=A0A5K1K3G9_9APHY|nr:Pheromone receptor CPRa1p [Ganoderma boninense]